MDDLTLPDVAPLLPVQRTADAHRDHLAGGYLGCPGCVAEGVLLCPACLTPGVGRHWRCIGWGRWLLFAVYCLVALAVLVGAVALAVRFRTAALTGASAGLLLCLAWPYRCYVYRLAAAFPR